MKLAWLTDIHLNFLDFDPLSDFMVFLFKHDAEAFLISGDIAEGDTIGQYLNILSECVSGRKIYFILGNHDFYRSSIERVRQTVREVCRSSENLVWLPGIDLIELSADTALIGHDGWADGRFGDYHGSGLQMSDHHIIEDFRRLDQEAILEKMQELAAEGADHLDRTLRAALAKYDRVVALTHPPPFEEACLNSGRIPEPDFLPHYASKVTGETLKAVMQEYPGKSLTVLCGHVHYPAEVEILPNLKVIVGGARYSHPEIQRVIEV